MMSQRYKLILALLIFFGGVLVLSLAYMRSGPVRPKNDEPVISETVRTVLDPDKLETALDESTLNDMIEEVRRIVAEQASLAFPTVDQTTREDLARAFTERLELILDPVFERDFQAAAERGDSMSLQDARASHEKWASFVRSSRGSPRLSTARINIRQRNIDTTVGRDDALNDGFGVRTGTRNPSTTPIPPDPVSAGFTVADVSMPMSWIDVRTHEYAPAIVGYRFAWHPKLKKWVPYESYLHDSPKNVFTVPPL